MESQQIVRLGRQACSANRLARCNNCITNIGKDEVILTEKGNNLENEINDDKISVLNMATSVKRRQLLKKTYKKYHEWVPS